MSIVDVLNLTRRERDLSRDIYCIAKDEKHAARLMVWLFELIQTGLFRIRNCDTDAEYNSTTSKKRE